MASIKFEQSQAPGGAHHLLNQLVGDWRGSNKTWFEPGKLADESAISGSVSSLLGGKFVLFEYQGKLMDKVIEGRFLFGYSLQREKFQESWIDSFHMGADIMSCEGERTQEGFQVLGEYDAPEGPPWGWRTVVNISEEGRLVVTMYNITPEGEEAKAVEMALVRG